MWSHILVTNTTTERRNSFNEETRKDEYLVPFMANIKFEDWTDKEWDAAEELVERIKAYNGVEARHVFVRTHKTVGTYVDTYPNGYPKRCAATRMTWDEFTKMFTT